MQDSLTQRKSSKYSVSTSYFVFSMTSKLFSRVCLTVDDFDLTDHDKLKLKNEITVPLPIDEKKRLEFLREAKIFDTDENEEPYDRYTTLAARIFEVMRS